MMRNLFLCVFLNTWTILVSQRTPTITYITREKIKNVGGTMNLECSVQFAQDYPVLWVRIDPSAPRESLPISSGSSLIVRDNRFSMRYDMGTSTYILQVKDLQESDTGTYQCQVVINATDKITADVKVRVRRNQIMGSLPEPLKPASKTGPHLEISQRTPSISFITREKIKNVGGTMNLECSVEFAQDYPVLWVRIDPSAPRESQPISSGSSLITRDNRISVNYDIGTSTYILKVKDVQESDTGTYQCQVVISMTNKITADVKVLVRNVHVPDENNGITAVDGSAAVLHCAQDSNRNRPSPTRVDTFDDMCFWMHGDSTAIFSHRLSDNPGYQILFDEGKRLRQCDLVIYKVNSEHEGDWYCSIGNRPRRMVRLNITGRINGHQPDVSAIQGSSIVLPCHLRNTNQLCYWTHGNVAIINRYSEHSDERLQIISDPNEGNCDLLIQDIQEKDGGNWYCHILGNEPMKLELEVKTTS